MVQRKLSLPESEKPSTTRRADTLFTPPKTLTSQDYARIIQDFRKHITSVMDEQGIPGRSIALVTADTVLCTKGFGCTDDDHRVPVTDQTMFSIQSMSKTFTATLVMIAAQEGLVDLNEPISTYLPESLDR